MTRRLGSSSWRRAGASGRTGRDPSTERGRAQRADQNRNPRAAERAITALRDKHLRISDRLAPSPPAQSQVPCVATNVVSLTTSASPFAAKRVRPPRAREGPARFRRQPHECCKHHSSSRVGADLDSPFGYRSHVDAAPSRTRASTNAGLGSRTALVSQIASSVHLLLAAGCAPNQRSPTRAHRGGLEATPKGPTDRSPRMTAYTNNRHPDRPLGAGLGLLLRHPRGQ